MSEAILKRKTFAKYNNNSVGKGFSLHGTLRNQGWVGQDTIGRSFPRTIMKGNIPKGYGGCCGTYPQYGIISSAVNSLNDPKVIKSSVLDNDGMLRTKNRWIWRPQPFSTTKQDTSRTTRDQSEYITSLSANISNRIDSNYSTVINQKQGCYVCDIPDIPREARPRPVTNPQIAQPRIPGKYTKTNMSRPERNNPIMGILGGKYVNYTIPQSNYIAYLGNQCAGNDVEININSTAKCTTKPMPQNLLQVALIGGIRSF